MSPPRFRALHVRTGFDLEPELPDPAPAHVDPEGAMHPALLEPAAALTLHRWPTPGARAALCARLLSEPGNPDPDSPQDPVVAAFRLAAHEDWEAEASGVLALLLLRGAAARQRADHRPPAHGPLAPWEEPDFDGFRRARARLNDLDWGPWWLEIAGAEGSFGDAPAFVFERSTVRSASSWLRVYRAWWAAAEQLGQTEVLPEGTAERELLADSLAEVRAIAAGVLGGADSSPAGLLGAAIRAGSEAELAFLSETGAQPRGAVRARWLVDQQLRALRDLSRATRARSLRLHLLVRRCELARFVGQLAYRCVLLDLWLGDAAGDDPAAAEAAILALPGPPHDTTLGAGLGRVLGSILLRRLRRGEREGAEELALRALALAPAELAVRVTANDLAFERGQLAGRWSPALLDSLREEQAAWDSVSARAMGAVAARALGDASRTRWFARGLPSRATARTEAWPIAALETLRDPEARKDVAALEALVAARPPAEPTISSWIALGPAEDLVRAFDDLELALTRAALEPVQAAALDGYLLEPPAPPKALAWPTVLAAAFSVSDASQAATALHDLRASAPSLRRPPLASRLRRATHLLADATEAAGITPQVEPLFGPLAAHLRDDKPAEHAVAALDLWAQQLEADLREPRHHRFTAEVRALRAELRVAGRRDLLDELDQLQAQGDGAFGESGDLEPVQDALLALRARLTVQHCGPAAGEMTRHADFDRFSRDELGIRPEALRRAHELVELFNRAGGRRDRKRLRSGGEAMIFELRKRSDALGGLRVFYRPRSGGWEALAAMTKFDDRQQREAIHKVLSRFAPKKRERKKRGKSRNT